MNDTPLSSPNTSVWQKLGQALDFIEKWILVVFLAGIVIFIFSGVLSRFVFHYSLAATEELARFMFVWSSLLGASAAIKYNAHGGIPLLANRFGPRGRKIIEVFVATGIVIFLCYLVIMTGVSTKKAFMSGQISTTTEIPVWTINFGMMLAFLIGVVRGVQGFLLGSFRPDFSTSDPKSK
jgi:C4-dicarboxylate transporter, DctQ subunit